MRIAKFLLALLCLYVFAKVGFHAWQFEWKAPDIEYMSSLGVAKSYAIQGQYRGMKDQNFCYPPMWHTYFRLVNSNLKHFCINIALTLLIVALVWYIVKFSFFETCVLILLMVGGIFDSYYSNLAQGNMTLFEMFFVWGGLLCVMKRSPWAVLFFLFAGSIKFYYWIFSFLLLIENRRWFAWFLFGVLVYALGNFLYCPDCIVLQLYNFGGYARDAYPFSVLPVSLKVAWFPFLLGGLTLFAGLYKCKPFFMLFFVSLVFAFAPRIMIYQYFFITPVIVYLAFRVLRREVGYLLLLYFAVPWAWNYYILTITLFVIMFLMLKRAIKDTPEIKEV